MSPRPMTPEERAADEAEVDAIVDRVLAAAPEAHEPALPLVGDGRLPIADDDPLREHLLR